MPKLDKTTKRGELPTRGKAIKKGAMARELIEKAMQHHASNQFRNNILLKQRASNYQMEKDRLHGIISSGHLVSLRDKEPLQMRAKVLGDNIKHIAPLVGNHGMYR